MAKRDMVDDLVDIVHPIPASPGEDANEDERDGHSAWVDEVAEQRESLEQQLRLAEEVSEDSRFDALLGQIAQARSEMLDAEERMRLLLAYGREFIRPQPYQLKDLALATGMSISGTRSAYSAEEIATVARRIGRQPRPRPGTAGTD